MEHDPTKNKHALGTDQLIDWLNQIRQSHPDRPLADLLRQDFCTAGQHPQDLVVAETLVDLVCIDLFTQHRSGRQVLVESYVQQFDCLGAKQHKLDLIDAELCVRRELAGQRRELAEQRHELAEKWDSDVARAEFCKRFPDLKQEISELLQMPCRPLSADLPPDVMLGERNAVDESLDFSVAEAQLATSDDDAQDWLNDVSLPISPPQWFVGSQIVSTSRSACGEFGRWLIRGRDTISGKSLLMKVIDLGAHTTDQQAEQILDTCERAAKVRSPSWVQPIVAAIEDYHLAVIRRWEYGSVWETVGDVSQLPQRLRSLAGVAYAVQAAHRQGAHHGGIHPANLLIDHHNKPVLVDGGYSVAGLKRSLQEPVVSGQGTAANQSLRKIDAKGLVKLVTADIIDAPGDWSEGLSDALQGLMDAHQEDSCGMIGDELLRRADRSSTTNASTQKTWRRRLGAWLQKQ